MCVSISDLINSLGHKFKEDYIVVYVCVSFAPFHFVLFCFHSGFYNKPLNKANMFTCILTN